MNNRTNRYLICFGIDGDNQKFGAFTGANSHEAIYSALVYWAGNQESFVENSICNAVCVSDAVNLFNTFSDSKIQFITRLDEESVVYDKGCFNY